MKNNMHITAGREENVKQQSQRIHSSCFFFCEICWFCFLFYLIEVENFYFLLFSETKAVVNNKKGRVIDTEVIDRWVGSRLPERETQGKRGVPLSKPC